MEENIFDAPLMYDGVSEEDYGKEPDESLFPPKVSLAMAYVPYQNFENIYDDRKALERGTLFASLDLPFAGGKRQ